MVRFESWHQCTSGRFEATGLYWCSEFGFFDLCKSQCKAGSIGIVEDARGSWISARLPRRIEQEYQVQSERQSPGRRNLPDTLLRQIFWL